MLRKIDNIRHRFHHCLDGSCVGGYHYDRFRNVVKAYHKMGGFIEWARVKHPEWIEREVVNE